jgi:hypothetical protein
MTVAGARERGQRAWQMPVEGRWSPPLASHSVLKILPPRSIKDMSRTSEPGVVVREESILVCGVPNRF